MREWRCSRFNALGASSLPPCLGGESGRICGVVPSSSIWDHTRIPTTSFSLIHGRWIELPRGESVSVALPPTPSQHHILDVQCEAVGSPAACAQARGDPGSLFTNESLSSLHGVLGCPRVTDQSVAGAQCHCCNVCSLIKPPLMVVWRHPCVPVVQPIAGSDGAWPWMPPPPHHQRPQQ
jgi:hypothetical protein